MNITCVRLTEILYEFTAGELPPETCEHIRLHLERCPPCVSLVDTYQITIKIGKCLPCRPMPESLQARLCQMLKEMKE